MKASAWKNKSPNVPTRFGSNVAASTATISPIGFAQSEKSMNGISKGCMRRSLVNKKRFHLYENAYQFAGHVLELGRGEFIRRSWASPAARRCRPDDFLHPRFA